MTGDVGIAPGDGWVAREDARLVGAVRFWLDGDLLRIGRLTVAPDRQGVGMGSRLLAAAEVSEPARRAALSPGTGAWRTCGSTAAAGTWRCAANR